MKQIVFTKRGGLEVLKVRESDDPKPEKGQVLVDVRACGVNFADVLGRMGLYPDAPRFPAVMGYEVSGVVESVGEGVSEWVPGDRVLALTRFGGYATKIVLPSANVFRLPSRMTFSEGAALPVNGLTAWFILQEVLRVRKGDRVLVHAAAGGVGLVALDLIKSAGGYAAGTASRSKHAFLKDWGYDALVDYRHTNFEEALASGEGFDAVLDPIGGRSWKGSYRLLRPGGTLVCFGFANVVNGERRSLLQTVKGVWDIPWRAFNPFSILNSNKAIAGINLGRLWGEQQRLRDWCDRLIERVEAGQMRVHVHAEVPFDEAQEAHAMLGRRENIGKIVLVPS